MVAISTIKLFNLLPSLAALAGVLNGIENVPTALAHSPAARHLKDHHRHLVQRHRVEEAVGAQKKKRTSFAAGQILQRADGSQCRIRPSALSSSITTSTSTSSIASSTSAWSSPASTTSTTPAWTSEASTSDPGVAWYAAPASSSSSSAAAVSTSASSSYSGGSSGGWTNPGSPLGAAWPNGNWANPGDPGYIGNFIGQKTSWYYTWGPYNVGSGDSSGLEFVPMLWGPNQVSDWWNLQSSWPATVKNALFFNEPNEPSQCNMAASDSISYWMNDMVPLRAKGIALGGAATTSAPDGVVWIQDIISGCQSAGNSAADCTPDFVPIHYYDTTVEGFQNYVTSFHQTTGLDIWITEYACQNFNGGAQCSDSDVWNFHQSMAPWFDSQDYIKRYSPFGMMENMQGVNGANALMDSNGGITSLGVWYISSS